MVSIRERIDAVFTGKLQPLGLTSMLTFHVASSQSYDPTTGKVTSTITDTDVLGSVVGYERSLVDGEVIQVGDLRAIVSGIAIETAGFEPDEGMVVEYAGDKFTIVAAELYPVGDDVAAWDIQLRGT